MTSSRALTGLAAVSLVFSSFFMAGCPDDGVPSDGLIILDDLPDINLKAIFDDMMSFFTGADSPFQVGDLVVGSDAGGFLRRILALGESGDNIFAETELASLAEAIEQGLLLKDVDITTQDFIDAGLIPAGGTVTLVDLSGTSIYQDYGVNIYIATGTLECTPDVAISADFEDNELETFALTVSGNLDFDFDVAAAVDEGYPLSFETDIIPPVNVPFATSIGPVPVTGTVGLRFPIGVVGTFEGDTSVTAGFDVNSDFSISALFDGDFSQSVDVGTPVWTGHEPVWSIEIGADVDVYVKVVAEVTLYESLSGSIYAQPYLNADFDIYPAPAVVTLTGGLNGGAAVELSIFDFRIWGDSWTWYGPSAVIYSGSFDY